MIIADQNGRITGQFTVPANVPVGTKLVEFIGRMNSRTSTNYTGTNSVITNSRQSRPGPDPLAQTFTLPSSRQIAGVDLWFTHRGTSEVRVQIRPTQLGVPEQVILAEGSVKASDIIIGDTPTAFRFSPVLVEADKEYAIVVLTDDAVHQVRIAEIGKWDKARGWVTGQPYQVGVLLSSSNAVTWTPHQKEDLTFRLHAAKYQTLEREIDLGTFAVQDASDFIVLAAVQRPSAQSNVLFVITDLLTKAKYEVEENQVVRLPNFVSGSVNLKAILRGEAQFSPVLFPYAQLAKGTVSTNADYITRAIPCNPTGKLIVTLDALIPGTAGLKVYFQVGNAWTEIPPHSGSELGDNWWERRYEQTGLPQGMTRVKLVLQGDPGNRPRIKNLRAITT